MKYTNERIKFSPNRYEDIIRKGEAFLEEQIQAKGDIDGMELDRKSLVYFVIYTLATVVRDDNEIDEQDKAQLLTAGWLYFYFETVLSGKNGYSGNVKKATEKSITGRHVPGILGFDQKDNQPPNDYELSLYYNLLKTYILDKIGITGEKGDLLQEKHPFMNIKDKTHESVMTMPLFISKLTKASNKRENAAYQTAEQNTANKNLADKAEALRFSEEEKRLKLEEQKKSSTAISTTKSYSSKLLSAGKFFLGVKNETDNQLELVAKSELTK